MDLEVTYREFKTTLDKLRASLQPTPKSVRLIAVSKTHPVEKIIKLNQLGQEWFGENYLDELKTKVEGTKNLQTSCKWSFIGTLQSNKIAKIVEIADEIQSAHTEKHFRLVDSYARKFGKPKFPVFILVNIANEKQKSGCSADDVNRLGQFIETKCLALELQGVMAIPPAEYSDGTDNEVPPPYRTLRALADTTGCKLLSLGMSQDLKLALKSGTDIIRIGTTLFGDRLLKNQ